MVDSKKITILTIENSRQTSSPFHLTEPSKNDNDNMTVNEPILMPRRDSCLNRSKNLSFLSETNIAINRLSILPMSSSLGTLCCYIKL